MIKKPSPLPWVLLVAVVVAALAALLFGREALENERERTAAALKASDEAAAKLSALEQKVSQLEEDKKSLTAQVEALSDDLSEKEAELDKLKATYDSLEEKMKAEIKRGDVQLTQAGGKIRVDMVDKILFDSGEAELSSRGQEVLARLGAVLAKVEGKQIQVSGHTDDAVISERLAEKFPTNWELSVARAVNVVRFLSDKCGVPPSRLLAAGYGEFHPIASNANPAGRARNRRIELLLTPALEAQRSASPALPQKEQPKPPAKKAKTVKAGGKKSPRK
ncbi:MAG: OmpA family protein [Myxococcales bacterium]|nr:OmpA family protein [Myxococcales bacterium]